MITYADTVQVIDSVSQKGVYRVSLDAEVDSTVKVIHSQGRGDGKAILVADEIELSFDQTDELILALQRQLAIGRHSFRPVNG